MTTTISEELLSLHRGCNPKQLTKISNVLQVEKDIEAFHSAILESPDITSNTAHILRESVVFPGNDYIGDDPAIESTHASAIHYSSAHHFVRRFWYGIIPVDGKVKFQTAENPGRDICLLFIECRSADISMAYLTGEISVPVLKNASALVSMGAGRLPGNGMTMKAVPFLQLNSYIRDREEDSEVLEGSERDPDFRGLQPAFMRVKNAIGKVLSTNQGLMNLLSHSQTEGCAKDVGKFLSDLAYRAIALLGVSGAVSTDALVWTAFLWRDVRRTLDAGSMILAQLAQETLALYEPALHGAVRLRTRVSLALRRFPHVTTLLLVQPARDRQARGLLLNLKLTLLTPRKILPLRLQLILLPPLHGRSSLLLPPHLLRTSSKARLTVHQTLPPIKSLPTPSVPHKTSKAQTSKTLNLVLSQTLPLTPHLPTQTYRLTFYPFLLSLRPFHAHLR
ncbi:hypothetical protein K435DRAFT_861401 [Dendrothele bispora CBS 962.96]|uniref:Uncharacterized protein n=1 Tax=Dendrothele bispora (strain CBS 962.96) TaxID=1314807 RepID=A0A4S8LVB3_DENBC|nr:hypothetical protein K435DRAFT_861401 [Dendrothele bispora CBS 962.96]